MNKTIKMQIQHLPENFTKKIHDRIRLYSITMLITDNLESDDVTPCSGTLCSFNLKSGIITARHVWEKARKHAQLVIMTNRGPFPLNTTNLISSLPKPNANLPEMDDDDKVPDIVFIYLDGEKKTKIESLGKVFYSIEKRKKNLFKNIDTEVGYWSIFGNPAVFLKKEEHTLTSFIYGTSVSNRRIVEGWDYMNVNINIPENPSIPKSFGGVSGGGVWRTKWGFDPNQKHFVIENITFAGLCFYQTIGNNSHLIAHGPVSIYKKLPDFLSS